MPVSETSNATTEAKFAENGMPSLQPLSASEHVQPHAAMFGKFKCIRKQILQHLLQAF